MSDFQIKATSAEEFVTKCRQMEDKHCIKFGFEKPKEKSFISVMVKDLDVLGQRYKENKEFITSVMTMIKTVLSPPLELITKPAYQTIRKEYLEFFNKFPWFEDLKDHILVFFNILAEIVINDNQGNAFIALHVIHNLNKYFKTFQIQFSHYKLLLDFFVKMLLNFDNIIQSTFYYGDYASDEPRKDLIEKSLKAEKPSNLSLSLLNEFMELMIFLDQMYSDDPGQKEFFSKFKDPFIYILAKSYDPKWLKFSHQTKEFFSLKN